MGNCILRIFMQNEATKYFGSTYKKTEAKMFYAGNANI